MAAPELRGGAQGERIYAWAYVPLRPALRNGRVHALLVRRHPTELDELAYYLYVPVETPLAEIVRAAACRWVLSERRIEDVFKLAKGQAGLDQYEVRSWTGWYRHTTLALLALAILAVVAAEKGGRAGWAVRPDQHPRAPPFHDPPPTRLPPPAGLRPSLVILAAPASSHRPCLPHQAETRRPRRETVTVGLNERRD